MLTLCLEGIAFLAPSNPNRMKHQISQPPPSRGPECDSEYQLQPSMNHAIALGDLQADLQAAREEIARITRAKEHALQQLKEAVREKKALEGEYSKLKTHYHEREKLFEDQSKALETAVREQGEQRRLARHGTLGSAEKVPDDVIRSKWKQLGYNIRSLAHSLAEFSELGKFRQQPVDRMRFITPDFASWLLDDDSRDFIIQAYLWCTIYERIFTGSTLAWAGTPGHFMKALGSCIVGKVPVFLVKIFPRAYCFQNDSQTVFPFQCTGMSQCGSLKAEPS